MRVGDTTTVDVLSTLTKTEEKYKFALQNNGSCIASGPVPLVISAVASPH
jgi:hypothetical protein